MMCEMRRLSYTQSKVRLGRAKQPGFSSAPHIFLSDIPDASNTYYQQVGGAVPTAPSIRVQFLIEAIRQSVAAVARPG